MMYNAAKIYQNTTTTKLTQKLRKTYLEMIAPMLLKAVYKFLNNVAQ